MLTQTPFNRSLEKPFSVSVHKIRSVQDVRNHFYGAFEDWHTDLANIPFEDPIICVEVLQDGRFKGLQHVDSLSRVNNIVFGNQYSGNLVLISKPEFLRLKQQNGRFSSGLRIIENYQPARFELLNISRFQKRFHMFLEALEPEYREYDLEDRRLVLKPGQEDLNGLAESVENWIRYSTEAFQKAVSVLDSADICGFGESIHWFISSNLKEKSVEQIIEDDEVTERSGVLRAFGPQVVKTTLRNLNRLWSLSSDS